MLSINLKKQKRRNPAQSVESIVRKWHKCFLLCQSWAICHHKQVFSSVQFFTLNLDNSNIASNCAISPSDWMEPVWFFWLAFSCTHSCNLKFHTNQEHGTSSMTRWSRRRMVPQSDTRYTNVFVAFYTEYVRAAEGVVCAFPGAQQAILPKNHSDIVWMPRPMDAYMPSHTCIRRDMSASVENWTQLLRSVFLCSTTTISDITKTREVFYPSSSPSFSSPSFSSPSWLIDFAFTTS